MSLIRAQLEHGDGVSSSEVDTADLRLQPGSRSIESISSKARCYRASNASFCCHVRVLADLIWRTRVVDAIGLNDDLNVDLVHVFRYAKETSGKILSSLDHAILGLSTEDWDSAGGCEVVKQM